MDATHNPEFTTVETYQAYADYQEVMEMVEQLYSTVASQVCGTTCIPYEDEQIELKAPWRRVTMVVIMSVLGAVVMPHNLFLHSEIIQSRQWNLQDEKVIRRQLKYEFGDTLFSMLIGWAINSAMQKLSFRFMRPSRMLFTSVPCKLSPHS